MRALVTLLSGALFGLGLIVSDMVNPARVLGFLDIATIATGGWDPTLGFVMVGALAPMALAWRLAARRAGPVCGGTLPGRPTGAIGARLLSGAAVFGAGWGLVGFCPGPALAAIGSGSAEALLFTGAMLVGMVLHRHAGGAAQAA